MALKLRSALGFQRRPSVFGGDAHVALVWRPGILIRHFEEYEIGQLFQIVAVAPAVVAERVAKGPDFGNDGFGHHHANCFFPFLRWPLLLFLLWPFFP